jgi:hypothetical protein
MSFGVEYKEDIISRIRDLIDGYDKDSILKEYLQNADDSGATELIVTFDKQKYKNLENSIYEKANNHALLIYNNSQFKEEDFNSIVRISAQGKIDNANSTGRFGQGFSSTFSISDDPSFVSNGRAYWFDVLQNSVSKGRRESIRYWKYNKEDKINDWLSSFEIAGFNKDFKGTIFRLPLRNEASSIESDISHEIFTFDDFLKWSNEWKNSPESLLFLRHVHKLVLQSVDEFGRKIIHLEINTKNNNEIEKINDGIQNELRESVLDICNKWIDTDEVLPVYTYKHLFEIKSFDQEKNRVTQDTKTFAMVNGLFRGSNNSLIKQAKKSNEITPNPRKVLPWAGVAVELNQKGDPVKSESKLFTFLPLPIKSKYPIHIHGWFDLDSKRTEITHNRSGDDKETLIAWNEILLEEGVGAAWSLLIEFLKQDNDSNYSLWGRDVEFELNNNLINGFYKKIANLDCFSTQYKDLVEWSSPKKETLYFLNEKNPKLFEAFKEHFKIIISKPTKFMVDNLEGVGIELIEITPEFIREYLVTESQDIKFPIELNMMPIAMLSEKGWLLEILKYCTSNEESFSVIKGLPLELTLNKKINKVGFKTLFDEHPNLTLFQNKKEFFVDTSIVNSIKKNAELPDSWLQPTLKNQLSLLLEHENIFIFSQEGWIKEVVNLIVGSSEDEFFEAENEVKELKIVYQENKEYGNLQSDIEGYSPFMPRDEDIENNLTFLDEVGMNIIHRKYVDLYKPLLKYDDLITKISSKTLITHLLNKDSFEFFQKNDTREYILDILTENIAWLDGLDESEEIKFYNMPFIEAVDGKIYSKNTDVKLFLPTNFTPPKDIKGLESEYEIISVEQESRLYKLFEKMNIEAQDINNYLSDVIIPFLEKKENIEDRRETLKWLSKEWESIKVDINNTVLSELNNSQIIPSLLNENELYRVSELYIPTVQLPNVLNDKQFKPITFEDKSIEEKWIGFLGDFYASKSVLSSHVLDKVNEISENENKDNAVELLNYIANNFDIFEEMYIFDDLKEVAWYPVDEVKDILKPTSQYTSLKVANELILYKDIEIAGGYYHVLDKRVRLGKKDDRGEYSINHMADKLGIVVKIPNENFIESYRELIKLPPNGQVIKYVKKIYNYIGGRIFQNDKVGLDIEEKSILINNQWVAPKYVYQVNINLTGVYGWGSLVGENTESYLAKGLIKLGIKEKPTSDFLIEQLECLPQKEQLKDNQLRDAKVLLKILQQYNDSPYLQELPLLTKDDQLILLSELYINDFPAYKNANEKNEKLNFCQTQFDFLAKQVGVKSLNENYQSKVYKVKASDRCHEIKDILNKDSFKEAVLRLLFHDKKIDKQEINEEALHDVIPSNLIFVTELKIEYTIDNSFLFRSDEATYDDKDGKLYILEQEDEDDMIEAIAKNIGLPNSSTWIERILRNKMNQNEIKYFLDSKKVVELPQKFDIDDDVSVYSGSNVKDVEDEIITAPQDGFSDNNKEELELSIDPKISLDNTNGQQKVYSEVTQGETKKIPKKDTSSSINPKIVSPIVDKGLSKGNASLEIAGEHSVKIDKEEIPPPINPKKDFSVISGDTSSNNISNNLDGKNSKKIVSSNDRRPVYIGKDKEIDTKEHKARKDQAKKIGDKGEDYVIAQGNLLSSRNVSFEKALTNNKGFDIYEKDEQGNIVRYIEVKTLTGKWGSGGVGITEHQLDFALDQKQKDKWWLFVVEGINTENPNVYQFKNPVLEANRFMFDSSWKQLAYQSEINTKPKVDEMYEIELNGELKQAKIIKIKAQGSLLKIEMVLENGQIITDKFSKKWRKVSG